MSPALRGAANLATTARKGFGQQDDCVLVTVCRRNMPKLKTHSGAAKRFKKTGTGKVKRGHAFARHILTSKNSKRKRQLDQDTIMDKADTAKVKRMIPY